MKRKKNSDAQTLNAFSARAEKPIFKIAHYSFTFTANFFHYTGMPGIYQFRRKKRDLCDSSDPKFRGKYLKRINVL